MSYIVYVYVYVPEVEQVAVLQSELEELLDVSVVDEVVPDTTS